MKTFSLFPARSLQIISTLTPIDAYLSIKTETEEGNPYNIVSRWLDNGYTDFIGNVSQDSFIIKPKFNPGFLKNTKIPTPLISGKISQHEKGSKINISICPDTYQSIAFLIISSIAVFYFSSTTISQALTGNYLLAAITLPIEIAVIALIYFLNYLLINANYSRIAKKLTAIFSK